MSPRRASVSVVVPFAGSRADAEAVIEAFARLRPGPGDEVIIADNTREPVFEGLALPEQFHVVRAVGEGSPARGRNAGGLAAGGEWLLFVDSDCRPAPDLIERHLKRPIPADVGVVGGAIHAAAGQDATIARYQASRDSLDQQQAMQHPFRPYVYTANFLVRADLWRDLGGFHDGIRNGEDPDFCWRVQERGLRVVVNDDAYVEHVHRESLRALWRQTTLTTASGAWLRRRYPDSPWWPWLVWLRALPRALVGALVFAARGQRERARFKLLDVVWHVGMRAGRLQSNRAAQWPADGAGERVQIWCDEHPGDPAILEQAQQLRDTGHPVEVVALRRPPDPVLGDYWLPRTYLEDDTGLERLRALVRLALRRPLAAIAARPALPLHVLAPALLRADRHGPVRVLPRGSLGRDARAAAHVAKRVSVG